MFKTQLQVSVDPAPQIRSSPPHWEWPFVVGEFAGSQPRIYHNEGPSQFSDAAAHSIFFVTSRLVTGIGWLTLYAAMDPNAKWGQVVGNILSEWTQVFVLVLLTKRLIERHSKESTDDR
jgi:hypothetical protein